MGAPSFKADPPPTDSAGPADPTFNLCSIARNPDGNLAIALPPGIRTKWSEDSARKDDWAKLLAKFDASQLSQIQTDTE